MTPLQVAAVVLTHNRSALLSESLRAVRAQARPPDRVYVVDNASDDGTPEVLRTEFPDVVNLRVEENLGGGGRALGIEAAFADGFDAYWVVDDDSPPRTEALESLVDVAEGASGRIGIVGSRGGVVRYGVIRHVDDPQRLRTRQVADGLFSADFVLVDGGLIFRRAVEAVGLPRVDYFIMMEDVEYSLRARRAGFEVLLLDRDLVHRGHVGSMPGTNLWRGYYQSRNHLRMALDFRSPSLLFGWLLRQGRFVVAALRAPDRRWERIRLRLRGVWDGLRGQMGRRVEPGTASR